MPATERNHELITYLAGQSTALGKTKMMGIGWAAATNETGLLGDGADVFSIANTTGLWEAELTLVDPTH